MQQLECVCVCEPDVWRQKQRKAETLFTRVCDILHFLIELSALISLLRISLSATATPSANWLSFSSCHDICHSVIPRVVDAKVMFYLCNFLKPWRGDSSTTQESLLLLSVRACLCVCVCAKTVFDICLWFCVWPWAALKADLSWVWAAAVTTSRQTKPSDTSPVKRIRALGRWKRLSVITRAMRCVQMSHTSPPLHVKGFFFFF